MPGAATPTSQSSARGAPPRRPARRGWVWIVAAVAVCAIAALDRRGYLLVPASSDFETYHGAAATVTRIIDGDTLEVGLPDALARTGTTRVRLWGVDAPELASRVAGRDEAEPLAAEAMALAASLAGNQVVTLRLEPQRLRDRWQRVLAHVELPDGSSLNEALLAEGVAAADDRWTHALIGRYAQVELAARRRKIGIWSRP
jgi:micrococcal nuclease